MKGKRIRQKGKLRLSKWFKKFDDGERVALVRDYGAKANFPERVVGSSGKIIGSRGKYKLVEIKDGNKTKTFIIHPIHLKKLK